MRGIDDRREAVPGVSEHAYRSIRRGKSLGGGASGEAARRSAQGLSIVVVGGANTATEVAGEIKATWPEVEVTIVSTSEAGDFGKGKRLAL